MIEPFYFGPESRRLYGARYLPPGQAGPTALLICTSWGCEALRLTRALHRFARGSAQSGVMTLRFDYFGTGDSVGQSGAARLDHWLADVAAATAQLKADGARQIWVLGVRLGVLLAAEAQRRQGGFAGLLSWDAPASGREWLEGMSDLSLRVERRRQSQRLRASPLAPPPQDELMGWPLALEMQAALVALPDATDAWPRDRQVCLRSDGRQADVQLPDPVIWDSVARAYTPYVPSAAFDQMIPSLLERLR